MSGGRGGKVNSHGIVQEESDCSRMLYESTFKGAFKGVRDGTRGCWLLRGVRGDDVLGDDVIGDVLGGVLESASIYFSP